MERAAPAATQREESDNVSTDAGAPRQYGDVAAVYDALMAGVPHGPWLTRIEAAVRERGRSPRSVLDIACGTGIVTELLARRGYAPVWGVDLSPAMVAVARTKAAARGHAITYVEQDAAALDLGGRTFDLVVSLFDSLNYITDPGALRSAFRRIFLHTNPGGLFAFDLNSMYALAHDLFTQTGTDGPVRHVWKSYWDRETRTCRVEMAFWVRDADTGETRHFTETHVQRAYTVPEITEWLGAAGWIQIEVFSGYGNRPPGPKSDRLLFVAERDR
jgi:ubiquinone/menaquinone biosynthesis C-methylase UbiE